MKTEITYNDAIEQLQTAYALTCSVGSHPHQMVYFGEDDEEDTSVKFDLLIPHEWGFDIAHTFKREDNENIAFLNDGKSLLLVDAEGCSVLIERLVFSPFN